VNDYKVLAEMLTAQSGAGKRYLYQPSDVPPRPHCTLNQPDAVSRVGLEKVSLYTLWQSMRRVWRLGQDKYVNVTFLSYRDTMEEEILRRMGVKMKYTQLLYGKEAAGCLVEVDSDDIQREIIQAAMEGKAFKSAGEAVQSIFGNSGEKTVRVSTAPTGSPVAASPVVLTVTHFPEGEVVQLGLFPGFEPVAPVAGKRCR
jgi:hypothetical protein